MNGVIDFGLGALLLVAVLVIVPKALSRLERNQLMRQNSSVPPPDPPGP